MKIKMINNGYVVCVGEYSGITSADVIQIGNAEFDNILNELISKPIAPEGYDYRLRADTLEWELYELPPMPIEEEATAEDYEAALAELGVK